MTVKNIEQSLYKSIRVIPTIGRRKAIIMAAKEHVKRWREVDGVIYIKLPATNGTTYQEWKERLMEKGFRFSKSATKVFGKLVMPPTTGVIREIAVLKGVLFEDGNRTFKNIQAEGDKRGLKYGKALETNIEILFQIREMLSDEDFEKMGLKWIVVMCDSVKDSKGNPFFLRVGCADGGRWVDASYDRPGYKFVIERGFALMVQAYLAESVNSVKPVKARR